MAEDALTDEQIAERCGISRQSLDAWKRHPEFATRVASIIEDMRAALLARGIAAKQNRLDGYNDMYQRLRALIEERGKAEDVQGIAGGNTGLLVHRERVIGGGKYAQRVDEYEYDAAVPAELRAVAKQAAQELGEWTEKHDIKADVLIREYGGFDPTLV